MDKIQKKLMTKFSNKFKKPYFWTIFPILGSNIFFLLKNPALSHTTPPC